MANAFQRLPIYILLSAMLVSAAGSASAGEDAASWPASSPIEAIHIQIEDEHPNGVDWAALARVLIRIKKGEMITPDVLSKAEKALAPFFGEVKASVSSGAQGVEVTFILQPFKRIKSIDIDGAYPLFEKDVGNAMTVTAGDIFRAARMPAQEALIAQLYLKEGYVAPQVRIDWAKDSDDGHYRLRINIDKGPYYVMQKVQLHGNHFIGDGDLLSRMSTWRTATFFLGAGRFEPQQLKKDVRKLIAYYRKKGYAQARITSSETFDAAHHSVQCKLVIEEGPHYIVDFQGNEYYSAFRLRRNLVLTQTGDIGNIGLRRSIQSIRRRYLKKGFADVKVNWQEASESIDGIPQRVITISIEEGARHIVESVHVKGNAHMDTKSIKGQMLTRPPTTLSSGAYVADTLQEDLAAINSLYWNSGFLSARATDSIQIGPQDAMVRVVVIVDEGPRTRVGKITLQGNMPVDSNQLQQDLVLKSNDSYVPAKLQTDENKLSARIAAAGYPHVQVKSEATLRDDQTRADIVYVIESGPYEEVGEIFFLGNFRTRDSFMARELHFKTGDPFVLQKVLEAQRNLRDLNIFDSMQVRTIGLKEADKQVHLLNLALESKPYYVEAGGGYQTDKGIYGRTKIGDHNFLGRAMDVSLSVEGSQVGNRWAGGITDPRFLGTSVKAKAGVYSERSEPFNQDFGTNTAGGNVNFAYDWGKYFTNALAVTYERRQQFLRVPADTVEDVNPGDLTPRTIVVTTPSVLYDSRDSFIRPHQGVLTSLGVDISKGLESTMDDFLKYRFDLRLFHPLHQRITLAGHVWTGYIASYQGDPPPQDQLFFLGGTSTVRGFDENLLRYDKNGKAVGGLVAVAASLEARVDIGKNFELIPFVDTGTVQDALVAAGEDDFRWTVGLGLEYITPIGPVGLFFGHKLDRRPGESSGQIHIAVGYTF